MSKDLPGNVKPQDLSATEEERLRHKELVRINQGMGVRKTELSNKRKTAIGGAKAELSQELNELRWLTRVRMIMLKAHSHQFTPKDLRSPVRVATDTRLPLPVHPADITMPA